MPNTKTIVETASSIALAANQPSSNFWQQDCPAEVILKILSYLSPQDLAKLDLVCWRFYNIIRSSTALWRDLYLTYFDTPKHAPKSWATAVQNLTKVERILRGQDFEQIRDSTGFLGSQILPLMLSSETAHPRKNISFLRPLFNHASRRSPASTLLRQSALFRRCGMPHDLPADSPFARQLSARLHVYSGLPLELRESEYKDAEGAHWIHPYARSRVYDLRKYKRRHNGWGPFMDDKSWRVDWEKVQAIWLVLGYGLRMISERHNGNILQVIGRCMGMGINADEHMWQGLAPGSYTAVTADDESDDKNSTAATAGSEIGEDSLSKPSEDGVPPIEYFERKHNHDLKEAQAQRQQALFALEDPYGVTGTWIRVVNFLDYHDLYALNFRNRDPVPDHIEYEPVQTAEAFRLILLHLWITKIEWPDEDEDVLEQDREVRRPTRVRDDVEDETPSEDFSRNSDSDEDVQDDGTAADEDQSVSAETEVIVGTPRALTTDEEKDGSAETVGSPSGQSGRSQRSGSTSSDGLYHKPAHGSANQSPARNGTNSTPTNEASMTDLDTNNGKAPANEEPVQEKKKVRWPRVHFEGRSSSLHMRWDPNANSQIRGSNYFYDVLGYVQARHSKPATEQELRDDEGSNLSHVFPWMPSGPEVRPNGLHPDDDLVIRWTTFSVFHGEPRWRSEGVQIGGLKSARGILGNWFDKDYDHHGPAGPTGFWKVSDSFQRFPKSNRRNDAEDDSD